MTNLDHALAGVQTRKGEGESPGARRLTKRQGTLT